MAVITKAEVKNILRLSTGSTGPYDAEITTFIPLVQDDLVIHLNNNFADKYVYRESGSQLKLTKGGPDKITDGNADFLKAGFSTGMDIAIEGGHSNVGIYTIAAVSSDTMSLTSTNELISQDPSDTYHSIGVIRISRVKWPQGLKLPVAKMIWYLIDKAKQTDIKSERIDDYAVTYIGDSEYPTRLIESLKKWKKARFA